MHETDRVLGQAATHATLDARDGEGEGLVERARRGDDTAFGLLVEDRVQATLRVARAILGNEAEAQEVTQEAFVSAWRNLPRLRDADRFDAWLNRIVMNGCRDLLRHRRRVRQIDIDSLELPSADNAAAALETTSLLAAFDRLDIADRQILALHHLHDLPMAEVARQLGIPIGTAKSRLWSARRALERAMEAEA
ncbi:MAG: RNA polymerase sigma factor [Chloroflexota bacterium]|jgi:RNA polymerase sigma-70 factor (ECF subfamily)